jgi:hypothetical protein
MANVLACKRDNCSGELAPLLDEISKQTKGYFCKRCGVTYSAIEQPKKKIAGTMQKVPPLVGEINGRIDDRDSLDQEKNRLIDQNEKLTRKLNDIEDIVAGSESGLGAAVLAVLTRDDVVEEVVS